MDYVNVLSQILKKSDKLINSPEFKEAYTADNTFIRDRKLSFENSIYFILSGLRKSLSIEISQFSENYKELLFKEVSKQAFSKARQNISHEAFAELCRLFVNVFYESDLELKKWNGFNVFAIDGTSLQVPDTQENVEYFGCRKNQYDTQTALASASAMYDVLNDVVLDAIIDTYPAKEKNQARRHIEAITNPKILDNSIITFDRGYPSFEFFNYLGQKNIFYVFRLSEAFGFAKSQSTSDSIHEYKKGNINGKARVIKFNLPDGTKETLITNIFDFGITVPMFKELYFLRWGIECKYKELKSGIEIEEFSGKKPITIKQDFYTSLYLSMLSSMIKNQTDMAIALTVSNATKYQYQSNRNFILNKVFNKLIDMLIHHRKANKIINSIIEKAKKIRSHIRPNRSCERKNKHPRKKHHYQIKSCL
jgi:hypothetical protein